ncbi:oxidoreductase [Actinophytocola gossypii]|uniref:SDR family NAD(P)-dependent oxidoreductase n=1 Tax=Actinophytocola gossypii TaxID=2812003 RepID=A0ABT2J5I7_9PSEU|nr:oxidoreductase [Actinophytocola gossypii]MCT2583130.1 SDR family NAD(P)-dependent oxidoreductase [Actinophytocola gossypii]
MTNPRVWLVTGANSGFGRAITEDAVAAGDTVVAAVRRPETMADLVAAHPDQVDPVRLDVTDTARIDEAVADVLSRHGRIDVLVNNAGRTQVGAVEETTDDELRHLFDLHFFGPAALIRAVLPAMRARRSGAIVNLSSVGGQVTMPGFSAYCATKFALEGLSEALAAEVGEFGVKVLVVEPGAFRTNLFGAGAAYFSAEDPVYADSAGRTRTFVRTGHGGQAGDPVKAAEAIRTALAADDTPLRLPLGDDSVDTILAHLDAVRTEIAAWESVARDTGFDE